MPLKVCLYITNLLPGGAERQIVNLARYLAQHEIQVALLHAQTNISQAHYLDTLQNTGVEIVNAFAQEHLKIGIRLSHQHADFFRGIPAPSTTRTGILYLAGALTRLRPDVIHSYLDMPNCTAGCATILANIPVHLASFRNVDPKTGKFGCSDLLLELYHYILARGHSHFEANSKSGLCHYARWLDIDPARISYAPNGIDPAAAQRQSAVTTREMRRELGIPEGAPAIVTLARFVPQKSPEAMLDIFARVHANCPEAHYIIAGTGMSADGEMGAMVRSRGLAEAVHLLGVRNEVAPHLACADVFLLPSRVEGFPNAVMEAMAAGLPVVGSHVGGVPDLVRHDKDGFLHKRDDVDGMAQSVLALLDDAEMRARFGASARQRVLSEFSLQKLGNRTLQKYRELLAETNRT